MPILGLNIEVLDFEYLKTVEPHPIRHIVN